MSLLKPILHVSGLTKDLTDEEIISALYECLRARLNLDRGGSKWEEMTGTVEFEKLENAEKAYATLNNYKFPGKNCTLRLSHTADPTADPRPKAKPQLIKFLPTEITPGRLFNLFRPFGPIYKIVLNHYTAQDGLVCFSGTAIIEFYDHAQALLAQKEMHCFEIDDQTIAVEEYDDKRDRNGRAKSLIEDSPSSNWSRAQPFTPNYSNSTNDQPSTSSDHDANVSRWASQQFQQPYTQNPNAIPVSPKPDSPLRSRSSREASQSPAHHENSAQVGQRQIDPCNLFIKGLDPEVESGDLFQAFRQFGTIVSARVMKNDATGKSKQFGFVSFTTEDATNKALLAMDGATIGDNPSRIIVRLQEVKKFKEGRTRIVNTSSPLSSHLGNGNESLNQSLFNTLSIESPELSRLGSVDGKTEPIAESLGNLRINDSQAAALVTPSKGSITSQLSLPSGKIQAYDSSPVSTVSLTPLSERERMLTAVLKLNDHTIGQRLEELIELLMGLPAKERKLCLFNPQALAIKVCEAKEIIETPDDVMSIATKGLDGSLSMAKPSLVSTALSDHNNLSLPTPASTPSKPDRAMSASSDVAVAGSAAPTPREPTSTFQTSIEKNFKPKETYSTLADLAKLPSKDIVRVIFESPESLKTGLIGEVDQMVRSETDEWINKLSNLTTHQQKQKVGEKVFKTLRGFGIKGCPKITVDLLDSEDLRSLAHLMNSFPEILKEKVMIKQK